MSCKLRLFKVNNDTKKKLVKYAPIDLDKLASNSIAKANTVTLLSPNNVSDTAIEAEVRLDKLSYVSDKRNAMVHTQSKSLLICRQTICLIKFVMLTIDKHCI